MVGVGDDKNERAVQQIVDVPQHAAVPNALVLPVFPTGFSRCPIDGQLTVQ
jgi:hypothetical protein